MVILPRHIHISDLHLNHPKVSSSLLAEHVITGLSKIERPSTVDTLVISGDVLDRPTNLNTDAGMSFVYLVGAIIDFCSKWDISLVVVRGTGNHDGDQPESFVKLNSGRTNPIDLVYVDKIMTWVDRLGYRWLGIPDESAPSAEQTKAEVQKLMVANGIDTFDFGTTHGYYDFMKGAEFNPTVAHDGRFYNKIVKYIIYNGHIHTSTFIGKVLTAGSYDRNRHGEEEPKGMYDISIVDDVVSTKFIENTKAFIFKTLNYPKCVDVTELMRKIIKDVSKYNDPTIWIRIGYNANIPINEVLTKLKAKYEGAIEFTTIKLGQEDENWVAGDSMRELLANTVTVTPILPTTILDLLEDRLKRGITDDPRLHLKYIKEFI